MTVRRKLLALGLPPLLLAGSISYADSVDDASARVFELESRLSELARSLKVPEDAKGQLAERRLIDAQVAYELKNYDAAAIILYDVIEKYPTSPSYPEALYYLADSLYLKRDFFSARRYFEKLVEIGSASGRYQEALQRLIELSLHTGDYDPVDGYLQKLAQVPSTEMLSSVPYVAGKYYYFRKQYPEAIAKLRALPPGHKYYLHGLYFIGAANVAQGKEHLQDALAAFDSIIAVEANTAALQTKVPKPGENPEGKPSEKPITLSEGEKLVVELAYLGKARILLEQGQLTAALDAYAKIRTLSPNFNDALYESAWVSIKGKDYAKAARQLDLLLLNAPESQLAPEVRLLTGNLYIRQNQFGHATSVFTKARDDYEPLAKDLATEMQKSGDANAYFRELITKNLAQFDLSKLVPAAALRWLKEEPDTARLSQLLTDESDIGKTLADAEQTIARLERALNGPGRVNVFPELARARTKGVEISNGLTEQRKILAGREKQLIDPVAGAEMPQLKALEDERAGLEEQLKQLPTKEESIVERQQKARNAFNELDKRASEIQVTVHGTRAQAIATNMFYRSQVAKTLPPEQQRAAQQELDQYVAELEGEQVALDALRKELEEAQQNVGVDDADMKAAEEVKAKYADVVAREHSLIQRMASRLSSAERSKADQIESVLGRVRGIEDKLVAYNRKIDALAEEKLGPIRATIDEEKNRVASYKQTLGGYEGESADTGGGVLADGLRTIAQRFYNVVIRADVGIIDVAWALKDSATKETNRLVSERKRELKLLDDEFKEVLREKP